MCLLRFISFGLLKDPIKSFHSSSVTKVYVELSCNLSEYLSLLIISYCQKEKHTPSLGWADLTTLDLTSCFTFVLILYELNKG